MGKFSQQGSVLNTIWQECFTTFRYLDNLTGKLTQLLTWTR